MKTIGLIGGMSWESSVEYYRIINQIVNQRLGGYHSARSVMVSVDFAAIEAMQVENRWGDAADALIEAGWACERAGADCLVLCTNTMHIVAEQIAEAVGVPLIHIADATADAIKAAGVETVGLLGTRFTMERDFYTGRLIDPHGLTVLVPDDAGRTTVHDIVYNELVHGHIRAASREVYQSIIADLMAAGAQGVILGCTEIPLLIQQEHSPVPVFDTTYLHAAAAVEFALAG